MVFSQVFQLIMVNYATIKQVPYFILGLKVSQKYIFALSRASCEGFTLQGATLQTHTEGGIGEKAAKKAVTKSL